MAQTQFKFDKEITKIYYSINEVADIFKVNSSLIRFWEKSFAELKPKRNKKGNRFFTKQDIDYFHLIYHLIKEKGMTIEGAKKHLKQKPDELEARFQAIKNLKSLKSFLEEMRGKIS